jgi:hypothetical protein
MEIFPESLPITGITEENGERVLKILFGKSAAPSGGQEVVFAGK